MTAPTEKWEILFSSVGEGPDVKPICFIIHRPPSDPESPKYICTIDDCDDIDAVIEVAEQIAAAPQTAAELIRVKEVNAELVEVLEMAGESIELLANKLDMPTESSHPKADADSLGSWSTLQTIRAILKFNTEGDTPQPKCLHCGDTGYEWGFDGLDGPCQHCDEGEHIAPISKPGDFDRSGDGHASDCAIHNGPAYEPGPCDCGYKSEGDS